MSIHACVKKILENVEADPFDDPEMDAIDAIAELGGEYISFDWKDKAEAIKWEKAQLKKKLSVMSVAGFGDDAYRFVSFKQPDAEKIGEILGDMSKELGIDTDLTNKGPTDVYNG